MNNIDKVGAIVLVILCIVGIMMWKKAPATMSTQQDQPTTLSQSTKTSTSTAESKLDQEKSEIILLNAKLSKGYDRELVTLLVSKIDSYQEQMPNDAQVQTIMDNLVNTYGPCVGIPDGECRE